METLTKIESELRAEEILNKIKEGEVFIHPTDTIYGIGCSACDKAAVQKVRSIKEREDTPFSIWVPDKDWIRKNCDVNEQAENWIKKLPGPHTLILKLKNKKAIAPNVNPKTETIGVRMPKHWFHNVVEALGVPIITTSANKTGKMFMTTIDDLDDNIKNGVRFIVYEGEKKGRPSRIVHLVDKEHIKRR